ncbi:MAG TPA: zinc-dependent alcohol dehydrogenase family protein [Candidatus Sulfotelmatobacter sp.]|nr:zinc-dependent alcohol dehydrogenase family protein [Candidatus Sulfotelmatobacter sp.]
MRAALLEAPGAPFRVAALATPSLAPGEVLVRVLASGVNPLDLKIAAGAAAHARHPLPAVLGLDLAGVVEAVGAEVGRFRPGDAVYGMTGGVAGVPGSLAEYAAVDARLLAIKPENLSMREAAALPLVVITAWEGLIDRAAVGPEQSVLVHGGAGGVGHVAIQLARGLGARVAATASARHRAIVERLGATFVDYANESVAGYVERLTAAHGFDVVYDTVGGATLDASFEAVRRYGHVVSALGWGTHALAPLSFRGASYSGVFTLLPLLTGEGRERHGAILESARVLIETGTLTPLVDPHRYTLETVGDAYALLERRENEGKIVVDVGPAPQVTEERDGFVYGEF